MIKQEPSFQEAITASLILCNAWERGELSDEVLADRITELIAKNDGARAFFAVSLSSDIPLIDRLPETVAIQFRLAGEKIVDLTIRNMAMSTAMALKHEVDGDQNKQVGSERIKTRCQELLRILDPNIVKRRLEMLILSIKQEGPYSGFLKRWDYNNEQKKAILKSIDQVAR